MLLEESRDRNEQTTCIKAPPKAGYFSKSQALPNLQKIKKNKKNTLEF